MGQYGKISSRIHKENNIITISANDLLLADELAGMTIFDVVHPDNDAKVNPILHMIGIDLKQSVSYDASQHRTLTGKVVVGYQISGHPRLDREFRQSAYCSSEHLMLATAYTDPGFARELRSMSATCSCYDTSWSLDKSDAILDSYENREESKRLSAEIQALTDLLFHIRPNQYKSNGDLKTPEDYLIPDEPVKVRVRKVRKVRTSATDSCAVNIND